MLVFDVFLSEMVQEVAGVWALIGARHTMDRHLLDLDHQPTPEPVLLFSWKLVCFGQVYFFCSSLPSTSFLITCIPPPFTETYTSTQRVGFCEVQNTGFVLLSL